SCTASFAAGTSITLTGTFGPDAAFLGYTGGCVSNTATCTFTMPGTPTTVSFTVKWKADLKLTKSGPATGTVGTPISYTLTTTNLGPRTSTNVKLNDTLPSGLNNV